MLGESQIFCRPNQIREAAILASCLPKHGFLPLIVLTPPPCTEAEHRELFVQARAAQRRSMEDLGSSTARHEVFTGSSGKLLEVFDRVRTHQGLQRKLTPLRSWRLHNRVLAGILADVPCERAIFLYAPGAEDLKFRNPDSPDADGPLSGGSAANAEQSVVPLKCPKLYFLPRGAAAPDDGEVVVYDDLNALAAQAWSRLRATPMPAGIHVSAADLSGLYRGLSRAMQLDVPLSIGAPGLGGSPGGGFDAADDAAEEVVIVEETEDASHLLAVLYASHRKLPLLCVPAPNLAAINDALAAFDREQVGCSKAIKDGLAQLAPDLPQPKFGRNEKIVSGSLLQQMLQGAALNGALPESLRALVQNYLGQGRLSGLDKVRQIVSRHIPQDVLQTVGSRAATVFTTGVPYGLVSKDGFDWATKPIGHIAGDMTLLLLNELTHGQQKNSFNLLFDPGYFRTTETQEVFSALTNHYCHPILLDKAAASLTSLMLLGNSIPVEMIFFNTHGAEDAIVLDDHPYDSELLVQWLSLPSRPIVFNNSCLSWVGVGRQFLRMGARGYIGTLWSVEAELAARFAKHVMSTLVSANQPCSKAISTFDDAMGGGLAYVYVGTAAGGMVAEREERPLDLQVTYFEYVVMLAHSITFLRGSASETATADVLLQQVALFSARIDEGRLSAERRHLLHAARLEAWSAVARNFPSLTLDPETVDRVIADEVELLTAEREKTGLDSPERNTAERRLCNAYRCIADLSKRRGDWSTALGVLERSNELCDEADEDGRGVLIYNYQEIAEILKRVGAWDRAMEAAEKARALILRNQDDQALMLINGVLGQLAKRTGRVTDALRYATEGFDLAVKLDHASEQSVFKGDLAQLLLVEKRYGEAENAALEAQRIARGSQDERAAIRAYGILGNCSLAQNRMEEAERYAKLGLQSAMAAHDDSEVGSFLLDLARIRSAQGRNGEALVDAFNGARIFHQIGAWELEAGTLAQAVEISVLAKDFTAFLTAGVATIGCIVRLTEELQARLMGVLLRMIQQAVYLADRDAALAGVDGLGKYLRFLLRKDAQAETGQMRFLVLALMCVCNWLAGNTDVARVQAAQLDEASSSAFCFVNLCSRRPPRRSRIKEIWRKARAALSSVKTAASKV
jgi:tetratricopeptide (TPR) repeat protein